MAFIGFIYKHSLYINLLTWQLLNIDLSSIAKLSQAPALAG
jgi:hypothetical protein